MFVVGIGGTLHPGSSTEWALRHALAAAEARGCRTQLIAGEALRLPLYEPARQARTAGIRHLVEAMRAADGLILASPGYHGQMSGAVKNALDYAEDLAGDARPYFTGRAVGCIGIAAGWQAAVASLQALRSVVHALRGWPTPFGAAIRGQEGLFDPAGRLGDAEVGIQLQRVGEQVVEFLTGPRTG